MLRDDDALFARIRSGNNLIPQPVDPAHETPTSCCHSAHMKLSFVLVLLLCFSQFSPWVSWANNIQYDTQSAVVGWQWRAGRHHAARG